MDPNDIVDIGAEFGNELPVPDFGRLGRGIAGGINATDTWAGRMYDRWYPPHLPDADMLVRTTASFPTKLERERQEKLDDYIANAQDMALGGPVAGGGRTKKKKRTKKRTKKRSKKRTKKKRSKKR